ncbi:MAG: hypothetical protein ACPG6V_09825, partial [Flavobacteriales bacterium]
LMFEIYNNNILAIKAASLYNKPMYDSIVELERQVKQYFENNNQEDFLHSKTELDQLKTEYKTHPATFLSKENFNSKRRRNQLRQLTKGGNGRVALVAWDSLCESLQNRIIAFVGYDPKEETQERTFMESIGFDDQAQAFYSNPKNTKGVRLKQKQLDKYMAQANVLNAIAALIAERTKKQMAFGKGLTTLWKNIAKVVKELPADKFPHALPKNHRRLKEKFTEYKNEGYYILLHAGLRNDNSQKIKGDIADWWLAMYSLPNKMKISRIMKTYNETRIKNDWCELSESAVQKYLDQPEVKRLWTLKRHGKEAWMNEFQHHVKRKKDSWFPNAYWAIDGTKLDWMHFEENASGMAARLKIDPVFDMYSEKLIGWSYSESENMTDHFKAIKMAVKSTNRRPYLFTYDNQSGHKSATMQELYDNVVAKVGGTHYPNKARAHNSPVEGIFKRFQQEVLNDFWWSDKQSPTVRTLDNKPNMEFLLENKKLLPTKEKLLKAWEVAVELWNSSKHPKYKGMSRSEVYAKETPVFEEVTLLDQVEMFWIKKSRPITYKKGGLLFSLDGVDYEFEVYTSDNKVDLHFRERNIGSKFYVKYDPNHLTDFVRLYTKDANDDLVFVSNAQPKREHESIPVLMQEGDKANWKQDYDVRNLEYDRDNHKIEQIQRKTGITPEHLIADQEMFVKMGGKLPKKIRTEAEKQEFIDL